MNTFIFLSFFLNRKATQQTYPPFHVMDPITILALYLHECYLSPYHVFYDGIETLFQRSRGEGYDIDPGKDIKEGQPVIWTLWLKPPSPSLRPATQITLDVTTEPRFVEAETDSSMLRLEKEFDPQEAFVYAIRDAIILRLYLDDQGDTIYAWVKAYEERHHRILGKDTRLGVLRLFPLELTFEIKTKHTFYVPHLNLTQWRTLWSVYALKCATGSIKPKPSAFSPQKPGGGGKKDQPRKVLPDAITLRQFIKTSGSSWKKALQLHALTFSVRPQDLPHTTPIHFVDGPWSGEVWTRGNKTLIFFGEIHKAVDLTTHQGVPILSYVETLAQTYPTQKFVFTPELGYFDQASSYHKQQNLRMDPLGRVAQFVAQEKVSQSSSSLTLPSNLTIQNIDVRRSHQWLSQRLELLSHPTQAHLRKVWKTLDAKDKRELAVQGKTFEANVNKAIAQLAKLDTDRARKDQTLLQQRWTQAYNSIQGEWETFLKKPDQIFDLHTSTRLLLFTFLGLEFNTLSTMLGSKASHALFYGGISHVKRMHPLLRTLGFSHKTSIPGLVESRIAYERDLKQASFSLDVRGLNQYLSDTIVGIQPSSVTTSL